MPKQNTKQVQLQTFKSETSKYRHLTAPHCKGNGIDIASGGDAVVPWAISFELPEDKYNHYNSNQPPRGPIHWRSENAVFRLPFRNGVLDFVYSSHLIEDYHQEQWIPMFKEWLRCLKPGGKIIVLVPEVKRWNYAVKVLGQCPNCSHHAPEPSLGDVSRAFEKLGMTDIEEFLTECVPNDYTIMAVGRKG